MLVVPAPPRWTDNPGSVSVSWALFLHAAPAKARSSSSWSLSEVVVPVFPQGPRPSIPARLCRKLPYLCLGRPLIRRKICLVESSADGRGFDPLTNSNDGRTRLLKAIQAFQINLNGRFRELRRNFPMKLLFFLVGFYCATAFATVIGQTGDWDILSAALAVAVVEVIGALMYRASMPLLKRIRNLVIMFNYWKAGLSLGLFLDSFKY